MSSIAYVIADWRTPYLAERARRSVELHAPGSEVVVVDAWAEGGLGYSAALNLGIARLESEPDIYCCLNADVEMLESDAPIAMAFRAYEDVAIIGPRQVDGRGRIVHGGIVAYEDGTDWGLDLRHRCWLWESDLADPFTRVMMDVPMVPGSTFYIRRPTLEELGGWPAWTRFYYEDAWLCYAARHRGKRVLYFGGVTWRHFGQAAPVKSSWRHLRMAEARQLFVDRCREAGIPLVEEP